MNNIIIIQTKNQKQSERKLKWKQFGKLNKYPPYDTSIFKAEACIVDMVLYLIQKINNSKIHYFFF